MAAVGVTAPSASALNHENYNILRNAQRGQRCLDINRDYPVSYAPGQLWDCKDGGYYPDWRQFKLVTTSLPAPRSGVADKITPKGPRGAGMCVEHDADLTSVRQTACSVDNIAQDFILNDSTGEIVTIWLNECLTAMGDYNGAPVMAKPCNGSLSQRWYF
jgi:hypothetical protein